MKEEKKFNIRIRLVNKMDLLFFDLSVLDIERIKNQHNALDIIVCNNYRISSWQVAYIEYIELN